MVLMNKQVIEKTSENESKKTITYQIGQDKSGALLFLKRVLENYTKISSCDEEKGFVVFTFGFSNLSLVVGGICSLKSIDSTKTETTFLLRPTGENAWQYATDSIDRWIYLVCMAWYH